MEFRRVLFRSREHLSGLRRLDGPEFFPAGRSRFSHSGQGAEKTRHKRSLHLRAARPSISLARPARRELSTGKKPASPLQPARLSDRSPWRLIYARCVTDSEERGVGEGGG